MRPRFRSIWILTVMIALTVGLLVLLLRWVVQLDLDLGSLRESYPEIEREQKKSEELDRLKKSLSRALSIKIRAIRKLIKGQVTLQQAAGVFRYLQEKPPFDIIPDSRLPGARPEEEYGRSVLRWVQTELELDPSHSYPGVEERLQAELKKLLAGPGGSIPAVNPEAIPGLGAPAR